MTFDKESNLYFYVRPDFVGFLTIDYVSNISDYGESQVYNTLILQFLIFISLEN
jgi:hypothetical protein